MEYKTVTSDDMKEVGKKIASTLKGGDVVLLYGELGSGKTTLTKGMAEELGVEDIATSPSFTLMNIYNANNSKIKRFVHADTYRLKDKQDLIDTGITDQLCNKDTLCIIEWPDKVEDLIKGKKVIKVRIQYINEEERKITVENGVDSDITFE